MLYVEKVVQLLSGEEHLLTERCVGKGLVVLLSGAPGTGKTLTVEAGMYVLTHVARQAHQI